MRKHYTNYEQEYEEAREHALDAVLEVPTSGKTYRELVLDASATVGTWAQIASRVYAATGKARTGEVNCSIRDALIDLQKSVDLIEVGYDEQGNTLYIRSDKARDYLIAHAA